MYLLSQELKKFLSKKRKEKSSYFKYIVAIQQRYKVSVRTLLKHIFSTNFLNKYDIFLQHFLILHYTYICSNAVTNQILLFCVGKRFYGFYLTQFFRKSIDRNPPKLYTQATENLQECSMKFFKRKNKVYCGDAHLITLLLGK